MRTRVLLLAGVLAILALGFSPAPSSAACTPPYCPSSPPAPPGAGGTLRVKRIARVKHGRAALKTTCTGGGACKGTLKLTVKIKKGKGKKRKRIVIARAPFSLADGASKTIKVKLTRRARRKLKKHRRLKTRVSGSDVVSSKVKLVKKKHRHRRHR